MDKPQTLSTAPLEHPAMDYEFLRQKGIRYLETLANGLWTDFNAHDPGITILEQLCYAITDLSYRTNYSIPDLLTREGESTYASLFAPDQILTMAPVTLLDLRRLIIDVHGIKNAWVEPVEQQKYPLYYNASRHNISLRAVSAVDEVVHLRGLYRIWIEMEDALYNQTAVSIPEITKQVAQRVHDYRGLCEDFDAITVLNREKVQIHARIEIEAVDDAEAILIEIYKRLANHISQPIRFYTLREMLDAGKPIDEIFEGPLLEHGFIDQAELQYAQRRLELRGSDIIHEIMNVPGVRAVRSVKMSAPQSSTQTFWLLKLDPGAAPKFDPDGSKIILERNGIAVRVNSAVVQKHFQPPPPGAEDKPYLLAQDMHLLQPPSGRDRSIDAYRSIQHDFPETYGIGLAGLPDSAAPQRKAQSLQLRAYLLFFDRLLASYFAQLASARNLFSFSHDSSMAYSAQALTEFEFSPDDVPHAAEPDGFDRNQRATVKEGITPDKNDRRNRFLNHLLARFAEQFTDYSLILYGTGQDEVAAQEVVPVGQIAAHKQAFLQNYVELSSRRGTGINYVSPSGRGARSTLEKRLQHKLGISQEVEQFLMVEHILLRPMASEFEQPSAQMIDVPFLTDARLKDPFSLQISYLFPGDIPRFKDEAIRNFIERMLREETPAHLSAAVYWLDSSDIADFKTAFKDWLDKRYNFFKVGGSS